MRLKAFILAVLSIPSFASASKLFLLTTDSGVTATGDGQTARFMTTSRGTVTTTYTRSTSAGPATLQFTSVAGGNTLSWITDPLLTQTISGTVTFNLWAYEDSLLANATITAELDQLDASGAVTVIASKKLTNTELTTSSAIKTWTATASATTIASGDRLMVRVFAMDGNGVVMAASHLVALRFNGPNAGLDGDSFVNYTGTSIPETYTSTVTATSTFTPTATVSATFTASASDSPTRTPSPSRTFSPTVSTTITFTPTSTFTPTVSATITFSPTKTFTPTPTVSATFTATPSFTPTGTFTHTPVSCAFQSGPTIRTSAVNIAWISSATGTGKVLWGTTPGNLVNVAVDSDQTKYTQFHSVPLSGLTANTTYYYEPGTYNYTTGVLIEQCGIYSLYTGAPGDAPIP